ncbi:MAG: FAD-dependent thymidylate synthase [Oscillospiraceae bacterium]|jgi:thymidylate synthase (FAD)|nr:FAD-dependent thymidylate synthase [Oscillospiraceae bacterium]
MLNVKLLSYTQDPEKLVASAAKLCYSPSTIEETREKLTNENAKTFVKMLAQMGHESPLEHASFTFGIEGVSRALLAQITRHRIASYSVQSQRYVKETQFEYIIPPEIENVKEAKEEFLKAISEAQNHYDNLTNILQNYHKEMMIKNGADETAAQKLSEKQAIEDARFVLPNACETKIICTFNARSLLNFFAHRGCNRAQWEIRQVAIEMLKLVIKAAPNIFCGAGPACVRGSCSEGKMTCGKISQVRDTFKKIKE